MFGLGRLTRPKQHFHAPQDLVNVHKSVSSSSKSSLQTPNAWHQATTSCRFFPSSRQHSPVICSFFQACTRGKSAIFPNTSERASFFGMFGEAKSSGPTSAPLSIAVSKQRKHLQSCRLLNALSRDKYRCVFLLARPWVRRAGAGLGPSSCLFGGERSG